MRKKGGWVILTLVVFICLYLHHPMAAASTAELEDTVGQDLDLPKDNHKVNGKGTPTATTEEGEGKKIRRRRQFTFGGYYEPWRPRYNCKDWLCPQSGCNTKICYCRHGNPGYPNNCWPDGEGSPEDTWY